LLKWIREEKECEWDSQTINAAAQKGNLEMVKYCVANECPIGVLACANAALNGQLEVLKYLREEAKAPWDWKTANWAAQNGHLHILEYLVERKFDQYDTLTYTKPPKRLGTRTPYKERTRTTTPNVYNTSSTITVLFHAIGDTKMESCTFQNNIIFINIIIIVIAKQKKRKHDSAVSVERRVRTERRQSGRTYTNHLSVEKSENGRVRS
jgi:hypothetical protein